MRVDNIEVSSGGALIDAPRIRAPSVVLPGSIAEQIQKLGIDSESPDAQINDSAVDSSYFWSSSKIKAYIDEQAQSPNPYLPQRAEKSLHITPKSFNSTDINLWHTLDFAPADTVYQVNSPWLYSGGLQAFVINNDGFYRIVLHCPVSGYEADALTRIDVRLVKNLGLSGEKVIAMNTEYSAQTVNAPTSIQCFAEDFLASGDNVTTQFRFSVFGDPPSFSASTDVSISIHQIA